MRRHKNSNLREVVYREVINAIVQGEFAPNDILTESELLTRIQVSKSPVRDALIELCKDGVLISIPRRGYQVLRYSEHYVQAIIRFRSVVEPNYLKQNWHLITPGQIEQLEKRLAGMLTKNDSVSALEHWFRNRDFHLALADIYRDPFFSEMLENALTRQTLSYAQAYWENCHQLTFQLDSTLHRNFFNALKKGDKAACAAALYDDITSFANI